MNILHHHLETVEAACFGYLNLGHESLSEVLKNDTIRGRKEGKDMLNEVLLTIIELLPVLDILSEVDLLSCPEGRLLVFVHFPHVTVLNGEKHKAVGVLLQKRFREWGLCLSIETVLRLCGNQSVLVELREVYWCLEDLLLL